LINGTVAISLSIDGKLTFPDGTAQSTGYQKVSVPTTSVGSPTDKVGMIAFDSNYISYCITTYVDSSTIIWKRVALTSW
jgi:hypothetical protein